MRHPILRSVICLLACSLTACGDDDMMGDGGVDASLTDIGPSEDTLDARVPDTGPDAGPDGGPDTGPDTGPDAGPDTGPDTGPMTAELTIVIESLRMGGGTVTSDVTLDCGTSCSETLVIGSMVTLSATPDPGVEFLGFESSDGTECPPAGDCTITMNADTTVTARFDGGPPMHTLSVVLEGTRGGTGSVVSSQGIDCGVTCEETLAEGSMVTLMAVPDAGSQFVGFESDDGTECVPMSDCTLLIENDTAVTAHFSANPLITLSETDRDMDIRLRFDNLAADLHDQFGGVRSTTGIAPGSGAYYVEGRRLSARLGAYGVAVASDALTLEGTSCGTTDQSFGISTGGGITYDDTFLGIFQAEQTEYYGLIADYRGASPVVYLIVNDWNPDFSAIEPQLRVVQTMTEVTTNLHFMVCGLREIVGPEIEVNPGNDTTNFPFAYDPEALLRAEMTPELDALADALVLGWGQTYAGPVDAPPVVTGSADLTIGVGQTAMLTATATDAEDGDLEVRWELLSSGYYAARTTETGGAFSFTPEDAGVHRARAWAVDSIGQISEMIINVTVSTALPQFDPVQLVPDALSGAGIIVAPDGLSTRWTGFGKMGIRANQGMYGEFQYFEMTRLLEPINMGGGLVVQYGNLNPYDVSNVPQSMSVNVQGGSWQNLIPHEFSIGDPAATPTYGFAVDYQGATPVVYIIAGDVIVDTIDLYDITTPVYPMLYGNPTGLTVEGEYDEAINFGASAFVYDPLTILTSAGIDVTNFEAGWGDANTP